MPEPEPSPAHGTAPRLVFFVSDGTGITAETLGGALLANFPHIAFARHTVSFVDGVADARAVVAEVGRAVSGGPAPLVFLTVRRARLHGILLGCPATVVDLLAGHIAQLEAALGVPAATRPVRSHGVGDMRAYLARMRTVEYAIEHDDGQSTRGLDAAQVILLAPSRCGKTPTALYLALQHGLLVANYPLTDDDFPADGLPVAVARHADACFGLTTTPQRLARVRHERRPGSAYSSLGQCALEVRRAEELYRRCGVPFLNSAAKSVEEMAAVIIKTMRLRP